MTKNALKKPNLVKYERLFGHRRQASPIFDQNQTVSAFLKFDGFGRDSSTFGPWLVGDLNMNILDHLVHIALIIDF